MSDGEGVTWKIGGDVSDLLAAYTKAEAASEQAGKIAADSARAAGVAFDKLGKSGTDAGANVSRGFASVGDKIDGVMTKISAADAKFQALRAKAVGFQGQALAGFGQGQGMSVSDLGSQVMNAGGPKAFAAMAGGPIGVASMVGGVAYGQIQQYAGLADVAEKARISAQEVQGLQKVLGGLGVTAQQSDGIVTAFAANLVTARDKGGELADAMAKSGVALTDENGRLRDTSATLASFAAAIKTTQDQGEQMRLATLAVGQELAGPFLAAINQSADGLAHLKEASLAVSSSFVNDLGASAKAAQGYLMNLGETADEAYAKIKVLLGAKDAVNQIKAANFDVRQARNDSLEEYKPDGSTLWSPQIEAAQKAARLDVLRAAQKAAAVRDQFGIPQPSIAVPDALQNASYGAHGTVIMRPDQVQTVIQPPKPDAPDAAAVGGAKGAASKADVDNSKTVLETLKQQLALTTADAAQKALITEQMKIQKELALAKVAADSAAGQQIAALVKQIDASTEAQKKLSAEAAATEKAWSFGAQTLASGIESAALNGTKFNAVAQQMLQTLAKAAMNSALLGTGPLAGVFGTAGAAGTTGGLFGMAISGFKGLFAEGGTIAPGGWGVVGEAGPEIVHGPANVTPFKKLPIGGGAGGGSHININLAGANGDATIQRIVMQGVQAGLGHFSSQVLPGRLNEIQMRGA